MPVRLHPLFPDEPSNRLVGVGRDESAVQRLREQYAAVRRHGDQLARRFYDQLFAAHPGVRALFKTDADLQRAKLMDSLDTVIRFLDRPGEQAAYLRELGHRHAHYGARAEHYPIVSGLLADAVVEVLGPDADESTRSDWLEAFRLISEQMLQGAAPPPR